MTSTPLIRHRLLPISAIALAALALGVADAAAQSPKLLGQDENWGAYSVEVTRWCGDVTRRVRSQEVLLEMETRPENCLSYSWLPYLVKPGP